MDRPRRDDLVLRTLERERGGVRVYDAALRCVRNESLREEWMRDLEQSERHAQIAQELCGQLGLDPEIETPGRRVVRHAEQALVAALELALECDPATAELVAAECVAEAAARSRAHWDLIGRLGREEGPDADALAGAHEEVAEETSERLPRALGWAHALWLQALGLRALPAPEGRADPLGAGA
jgi:rubrerythrin